MRTPDDERPDRGSLDRGTFRLVGDGDLKEKMDPPIVTTPDDGEKNDRSQATVVRDLMRVLAAGIALIGTVFGVWTRIEKHRNEPPLVVPPVVMSYYGDPSPASRKPVHEASSTARWVCTAELRKSPTRGRWICASPTSIDTESIGLDAIDPGGPCTVRVVKRGDINWTCETTISPTRQMLDMKTRQRHPLFFADLRQQRTTHSGNAPAEVCTQEMRARAAGGAWRCSTWSQVDGNPDARIAQPLDPGGPCTWRVIDEFTGVWTCQSTAAMLVPSG